MVEPHWLEHRHEWNGFGTKRVEASQEISLDVRWIQVPVIVMVPGMKADFDSLIGNAANIIPVHDGFPTSIPGIFTADMTHGEEDRCTEPEVLHDRHGVFDEIGIGIIKGKEYRF